MASYNYSNWYGTPQLDAGDDPYIQNYNYIQQNGTSAAAWNYLFKNWFNLKNRLGVQAQLTKMFGPDGYRQLAGQYAARGLNPQDAQILKNLNLPNQVNPLQRRLDAMTRMGAPQSSIDRLQSIMNNRASGTSNAARQGGGLGDYTFSRYDDGMQHLSQLNDPTWKTFGNPDRGPAVGQGMQQQSTPQNNPASLSTVYSPLNNTQQQQSGGFTQQAPTPTATPQPVTNTNQLGGSLFGSGSLSGSSRMGFLRR